jgi:small-conductance mechanosensitive channel
MTRSWLDLNILEKMVHWESFLLVMALAISAYGFYRVFLHSVTFERHRSLRKKFKGLFKSSIILTILFFVFESVSQFKDIFFSVKILPYLGLLSLVMGCVVFVQVWRLLILMYLFLTSMRTGVPILLVNIFTLILSLLLAGWIFTSLFGIQVGPLLATSAAFSIILGLALQDTLGNLFAGISLQLDNVFEIGNWVEIIVGAQKVTGQILEISWRSVILEGVADELIIIPNRVVAQSQISNWTRVDAPIIRSQSFRLPYGADVEKVKSVLKEAAQKVSAVKKNPQALVITTEMNESWMVIKLIYYIDNFGSQYVVGDEVINMCLKDLGRVGVALATPIIEVRQDKTQIQK